jgi:hypothetical protein
MSAVAMSMVMTSAIITVVDMEVVAATMAETHKGTGSMVVDGVMRLFKCVARLGILHCPVGKDSRKNTRV